MDFTENKNKKPWIILAFIILFMAVALTLRLIPAFFINNQGFLYIFDTDTWYNLRQIEVMVHNFPQYNWFDPMTAYPTGKIIDWGPLYPLIAATLCLITGATSRSAIISTAGLVTPIMAILFVPVMYKLGTILWNWKVGIVAAGLISIVSFQFFLYSSYGYVDHHIAEVLFTTLFFLIYLYTISYLKCHPIDLKIVKSLVIPVFLSAVAGGVFFIAVITSTTVLLTLLVIALFMIIQNILDTLSEQNTDYLLILNLVFLSVSSLLLLIFGIKSDGLSLTQYTIGIVYLYLAIIAETVLLFIFSKLCRGKIIGYLSCVVGLIIGGLILSQVHPSILQIRNQAINFLLGVSEFSVAVRETMPWTVSGAIANFNVSLILMVGGLLILGYTLVKKRDYHICFLLAWSLVMIFLTVGHQRFQLYLTIPVVLLTAICITEPIRWREEKLNNYTTKLCSWGSHFNGSSNNANQKKGEQKSPPVKRRECRGASRSQNNHFDSLKDILLIAVILLTIILVGISLTQDYQYAMNIHQREIPSDWIESLNWMKDNTPETGVPYLSEYNQTSFHYPPESYGIISGWDCGHWITFFAQRIPVTNAFQDNMYGNNGVAAFLLSDTELNADRILETYNGKYIITDSNTAISVFTGLIPWVNGSTDMSYYIKSTYTPTGQYSSQYKWVNQYDDPYFKTMIIRLHVFDGSRAIPDSMTAEGVQIISPAVNTTGNKTSFMSESGVPEKSGFTQKPAGIDSNGNVGEVNSEKNSLSDLPFKPIKIVPALTHYRLIHESPSDSTVKLFPESGLITIGDLKYVKTFEYVKGAHIAGQGIIEVPIVTNTGRTFVYSQDSVNGEFIVPYSTTENHYEVKATGPYRIAGTSKDITVTESDVLMGKQVS